MVVQKAYSVLEIRQVSNHYLQVFWEKRLQGLRACDSSEEVIPSMDLPRQMQG